MWILFIKFIQLIILRILTTSKQDLQNMHYDPLLRYTNEVSPFSPFPPVHTEIIDCIIRSDSPNKASLYVSNLQGVQNIETLKNLKVKSIITCAQGFKLDHPTTLITNYKYFPLPQNPIFGLNEYFLASSGLIEDYLAKSNCMVHCFTGSSKSIAVVIAYLMKAHSMKFQQAYSEVKRRKKLITLEERYVEALKQFQEFLQKQSFKLDTSSYLKEGSRLSLNSKKSSKVESIKDSRISAASCQLNRKQSRNFQLNKSKLKEGQNNLSSEIKNQILLQQSRVSFNKNKQADKQKSPDEFSQFNSKILSNNNPQKSLNQLNSSIISRNNTHLQTSSNISNQESSISHKQAQRFEKVLSSNHVDHVGVKRQFKSSSSSFKKEKRNSIYDSTNIPAFNAPGTEKNQNSLRASFDPSRSSFSENKSQFTQQKGYIRTERSENNSQNKSLMLQTGQKQSTQRTEKQDDGKPFFNIVVNPEKNQLSISRISNSSKQSRKSNTKQSISLLNDSQIHSKKGSLRTESDQLNISELISEPHQISPSKIRYFSRVNDELNMKVKHILNTYNNQMSDLRIKYQSRLKQLKPPESTGLAGKI